MARNRITGRETQKMQEFTQEQISQAERRGIEFPTDVKEQLFEYANLIGEEEKIRTLVRNLADALSQADEEGGEDLLDDAKMDIQELPDPTIGKLELRDYGYTAEDMVPLRKEAALDYHRMGSKIYCLGSDGSKGEYASKEMIQAHEGLFGMESKMWERIEENDLDYADEDFGVFQEPMSVLNQKEALKLYDAGADIYLITNFSSPIYVTERMEIERGPEHYQMSMAELERFRNLEWKMQKYPQIQSLKEANLLLGTRRTFGIYQIKDDSPGENYAFMNMRFIESHGMQIKKEDYKLVYVGELLGNMSLDDIFERFNIDRPEDFRGHSLSVSDIVVLNDGENVTAHFVDSISFEQLDSFLNLEEQVLSELAYEVGERYFAIQRTEEGYDYSFYDEDFRLLDGGVYENDEISIEEAAEELLEDEGWTGEHIRGDYDQLMEKVEEMDEVVMAEIQKSQGEYKPLAKVVGDAHVHVLAQAGHGLTGLLTGPQLAAVVQVAGDLHAVGLGGLTGLLAGLHQVGAQSGGDAGEVEPVHALKDAVPVEVGGLGLLDGGVGAVVDAHAAPLGGALLIVVDAHAVAAADNLAGVHAVPAQGVDRRLADGMGGQLGDEHGVSAVVGQEIGRAHV